MLFNKALKKVLGPKYELDLVFVPSPFMKNLNKIYRRKNKTANVLSFGLADNSGQIFFDPQLIKKEASRLKESFNSRLWRLYLHSLLHLNGMDHEASKKSAHKMELEELKLMKNFNI